MPIEASPARREPDRDARAAVRRRLQAAARIDAALRERAERSERAFAAEIERRRRP